MSQDSKPTPPAPPAAPKPEHGRSLGQGPSEVELGNPAQRAERDLGEQRQRELSHEVPYPEPPRSTPEGP